MWMVTVLVFGIFFVGSGPDDVARRIAGKNATPQTLEMIRARLHLNQPVVMQYWDFLKQLVWHHNLGYSYYHQQPVTTVLKQAFPITFSLAIGAAIIWLVIGVLSRACFPPCGEASFWDRSATTVALFFYSMPTFVLGLILLWVFYYQFTIHGLHWFPGQGYTYFTQSPARLVPRPGLAVVHAGSRLRGRLHPADAGLVAGGDERGLHPDGPFEGLDRATGDLPARPSLRPDTRS